MLAPALKFITTTAAFIALSSSAWAQSSPATSGSDTGTNASPETKLAAPPSQPYPASGTSQGYVFNLRPIGADFGAKLADEGVYVTGRTLQQAIGLADGGLKRGAIYEGFELLGVDLDMNRIAGIEGGSIHFVADQLIGANYKNLSGSQYVFNRAWAYNPAVRLDEFTYEQRLLDGRLDIRVGRIPVGPEFDTSPLYCEFTYAMCGTPAAYSYGKGYPSYLTSSTAAIAKADLSHNMYFNVGAFEDEPYLSGNYHNNWPGEDWAPDKWRGVTIPMQIGYKTTLKTDDYPRSYDIGAFIDTGDYNDLLDNQEGQNRLLYGGAARVDHGKSGIWLQAEQTIWRLDPQNDRRVIAFAGTNFRTSGEIGIDDAYFTGLSIVGLFGSRPNDTLNIIGQVFILNKALTTYTNTSLALGGMPTIASDKEAYVEINYGVALAPGVVFKPNFTYIINPEQVSTPPVATDRRAIFIGGIFSVQFPDAFGLPRFGG